MRLALWHPKDDRLGSQGNRFFISAVIVFFSLIMLSVDFRHVSVLHVEFCIFGNKRSLSMLYISGELHCNMIVPISTVKRLLVSSFLLQLSVQPKASFLRRALPHGSSTYYIRIN